jgi:hypothetical protein
VNHDLPTFGNPHSDSARAESALVGLGVLGYLYWDSRENAVVKLPGVENKKN